MSERKSLATLIVVITIAFFAVNVSSPILTLLSVDVAKTFLPDSFAPGTSQATQKAAVGVVKQTNTINDVFEVVAALALSFLAIRFRHKSLLLAGTGLVLVSAIGAFFSPTLPTMQVFFALEGFGTIMVMVMGLTMIGEYVPTQTKAKAASYLVATGWAAYLIGLVITNRVTNFGGWRLNFLLLTLPASALGLILVLTILPNTQNTELKLPMRKENDYWPTFKRILKSKSAIFHLIGYMVSGMVVTASFAMPFFMQEYGLSLDSATAISVVGLATTVIASLVMGRIISMKGAKILIVACALLDGVFTMIFVFMPSYSLSVPLDMVHVWMNATVFVGFTALALDQVPGSRGTFISMRAMFRYIGITIGAALGATLLSVFASYQAVGIAFGLISIAIVPFILLVKDTTIVRSNPELTVAN
jgi:MFS transporter, DHA1 family, multidrug resistance protein